MKYGLRITLDKDEEHRKINLKKFIEKYKIETYIFCLETGGETGKLHLQGYLETPIKSQSLRKKLLETITGMYGQSDYSITTTKKGSKDPVDESFINYICKGVGLGDYEIYITSLSLESHQKANKDWWDYNQKLKVVVKKHKKELSNFMEEVFNWIYDQKTLDGKRHIHKNDRGFVKNRIIDYFVEKRLVFNKTKFHNIYCYILVRVNADDYRNFIEHQCQFINEY